MKIFARFCGERCNATLLGALLLAGSGPLTHAQTGVESSPVMSAEALTRMIATGRDQAALDAIKGLRGSGQKTEVLDRLEGDALYNLGQLPAAEAAYARALAVDPRDSEAAQMQGLTLFRLGRPAAAIPLLEGHPGAGSQSKADPTYVLALCYMDTLRYDDARRAFATQFGFPPESAPAYLVAARMLLRREFVPVSQMFAEKALALDPSLPGAHELMGEIALAQGHAETAIAELEKERQRNPLDGSTYERLGDAYVRLARYPEAQHVLQQAVLLEPHATGPYILLGKTLLKMNQPEGAMTFLAKAETMDPANYMTHNLLAQAYRAMGRTADASRELELTQKVQAADEPKVSPQ